jgi:signal transduction histidine kinase
MSNPETGTITHILGSVADLISDQREVLLSTWRSKVRLLLPSAKSLDTPALNDHIPKLLEELVTALRTMRNLSIEEKLLKSSPPAHGIQRQQDHFDIIEVVGEYNILRNCISDLAETNGIEFRGNALRILNQVFDDAVGLAVQTFAAQQALEIQQRREEYLAFVAHDLRTPLNAIALSARVLEHKSLGPSSTSENQSDLNKMFRTLHRNIQHIEGLVDRVLKESGQVQTQVGLKLERRSFDLWPFVEALLRDLDPIAGTSRTELINEVPDDLSVNADAGLLQRVFQNLITNAIRYTPGSKVVVGARQYPQEFTVECWVQDSGSGIPADDLEKIFEKGMTDSHDDSGLGLGLAIVKTFVEAHGGEIVAQSKEGAGSLFRFTLPLTQ